MLKCLSRYLAQIWGSILYGYNSFYQLENAVNLTGGCFL